MTQEQEHKTLLPDWAQEIKNRHHFSEKVGSPLSITQCHADRGELLQALETALGKVERVKEALRFYAEQDHLNGGEDEESKPEWSCTAINESTGYPVLIENGAKAKQALKELEE